MAQASVSSGGSSSFGSFRLTTFVNAGNSSPLSRTTSTQSESNRQENGTSMAPSSNALDTFPQNILPSPQLSTMSPPVPDNASTTKPHATSTTSNAFGILEITAPQHRDGKLGPHRDGRVRNPVPRKLKGKTDDKNGNFAVMHMDMTGTDGASSIPRAEAAQRTSENTANAAKSAQKDGYVPVKRRKVQPPPPPQPALPAPAPQTTPIPPPIPISTSKQTAPPIPQQQQQSVPRRSEKLGSEETKYEQARLLTLLRSITPITVVDQICKALAFFGGIPGAPPPEDGSFPQSAEANGSGALFVGWLSEIFPDLDRKDWRPVAPKSSSKEVDRAKRPRGRPKGSKATKARKDKGVKKGPKSSTSGKDGENGEDEWVDVEGDSRMDMSVTSIRPPVGIENTGTSYPQTQMAQQTPSFFHGTTSAERISTDGSPNMNFSPTTANMSKRRPGRPKGSRNQAKDGTSSETHDDTTSGPSIMQMQAEITRSPVAIGTATASNVKPKKASSTQGPAPAANGTSAGTAQATPLPPIPPTPAKRKPKAGTKQTTVTNMPVQASYQPPASVNPPEVIPTAANSQIISVPPVTGEKRKRAPRPKHATAANKNSTGPSASPMASSVERAPSMTATASAPLGGMTQQNNNQPGRESPILPPPKRQRKPKNPSTTSTKKTPQLTGSPASVTVSASAPSLMLSPMSNPIHHPSSMQQSTPIQQPNTMSTIQHSTSTPQPGMMSQSSPMQKPNQGQQTNAMQLSNPMQKSNSVQRSTPTQQSTPIQQSNSMPQSTPMQQSMSQSMLSQSIPQSILTPTMVGTDSTMSTSRPSTSRASVSRASAQGLEAHYDPFASFQQQLDPQPQQRLDQNSLARASPILNSTLSSTTYYQPQQTHQQQSQQTHQQQQQQQQQPTRHMSTSYGHPFASHQTPNPYHTTATTTPNNLYRTAQQHNNHSTFSPRQQQTPTQNQYSQFSDSSFLDLPALDSIGNNATNVGAYGQNLNRSTSTGSFGAGGHGLQMPNGFDATMNENELRERLLRNIGRR